MGRNRSKRRGRPVTGLLLLDKPQGLSSNEALQKAKFLFYANKAGHTGSLDPLATGLLPLCFGEATKFSQFLLEADKGYTATAILGATSNTEDADGELSYVADPQHLSEGQIKEAAISFLGKQKQVPPMYSALKQNGKRLYDLAREGIEVEREARDVDIKRFEIGELKPFLTDELPEQSLLSVEIKVEVSKGTYVRSLAASLGEKLGVGAYISQLRRISVGGFSLEACDDKIGYSAKVITLEQLQALKDQQKFAEMDELLVPVSEALQHLPEVKLDENSSYYLRQGNPVQIPKVPNEGVVRLVQEGGEFVGVGEINDDGLVAPRRLVVNA